MSKHILLTGASGLIGKHLTHFLLDKGYEVSHLSRQVHGRNPRVKTYIWDVHKGKIDDACIDGVDIIIHLAGAGVAGKRWTDERKKEIIDSRVKSIQLIYGLLRNKKHQVKTIISASATGYYGNRGGELMTEDSKPGNDFLSGCCVEWEAAADEGEKLGLRVVKLRTGVVLDKKGGALKKMAAPVKWFIGSPLGNGEQWIPWIHWHDVVKLYLYAIVNNKLEGVFNMVAPKPVTNKQLTRAVAEQLHRPLWAPNVPAFMLKLLLGEMGEIVLGSTKVSPQKIEHHGFVFEYANLPAALKAIYG
jgi:uncharacterized protein (TIGR01777 family)